MALTAGTRLGGYEIVAPLGAGGMGEVYRARDTKLNRDVALKVLPESFVHDGERIARFRREAQVLASLNHPHIGGIYGLEDANGVSALVLELVEGPTLADRIARGPIPLDEALPIAKQIAEALEAAHEQGIIHRDLKPANIKVRADGTVKVLDFGLAKAMDPPASSPNVSQSPTITSPAMTQAGMILGTAAYMSPEQAKGRLVDKRSDVWAFGCVLFEMLTRTRAFDGEDVSETLARVLMKEPDWSALPSATPESVRRLLRRCLEKDRGRRIPDIAVARLEFDEAAMSPVSVVANRPLAKRNRWRVLGIAGAVLAAAIFGFVSWRSTPQISPPATRFSIVLPENQRIADPGRHVLALSPDGRRLVYVADQRLYIRRLDELEEVPIRGGDGNPALPFFSPNGQWIGFWQAGSLRKLPIEGGTPTTVCAAQMPLGAQWTADDQIVYGQGPAGIMRVSASGGVPELLVKAAPGESLAHPHLLPGNQHVIFTFGRAGAGGPAAFTRTGIQSLRTGVRSPLLDGTDARYLADGYLLFGRRISNEPTATVFLMKFDPRRPLTTGEAISVLEGVRSTGSGGGAGQQLSVSAEGSLVYLPAFADVRNLVWLDRSGREEPLPIEARDYNSAKLSPDGTRIALDVNARIRDIWIGDVARATATRLTFGPMNSLAPVWSSDGKHLFFACDLEKRTALCRVSADGTGMPEQLTSSTPHPSQIPFSVTPDGRTLIFQEAGEEGGAVMALDLMGDHASRVVLKTKFNETAARISPDGQWMAYSSDESGQDEVYVRPFPAVEKRKWTVSSGGGRNPVWTRDGRELFYVSPSGIASVHVTTSPTFKVEGQKTDIAGTYFAGLAPSLGSTSAPFDVSQDGQRLLLIKQATRGASQIVVVEHWLDDIKKRLGR